MNNDERHISSAGHAVDTLLDMFTLQAYGIYGEDLDVEPVPVVDGLKVCQRQRQQHQLNSDGLHILCPQFDAEKRATEEEIWKLLRRRVERYFELCEGRCLKCHLTNDQPKRRNCSKCEGETDYGEKAEA